MSSIDQAVETQLSNIQKKTGKSMEELAAIIKSSGLSKHSEIRALLQRELGLVLITTSTGHPPQGAGKATDSSVL